MERNMFQTTNQKWRFMAGKIINEECGSFSYPWDYHQVINRKEF
jgi:hypothetical protein